MFRYWVMARETEESEEKKISDHAFEETAVSVVDRLVESDYYEARVVDRIHMETIYKVGQ